MFSEKADDDIPQCGELPIRMDAPENFTINAVVGMPQVIANIGHAAPGNFGCTGLESLRDMAGGLAEYFKKPFKRRFQRTFQNQVFKGLAPQQQINLVYGIDNVIHSETDAVPHLENLNDVSGNGRAERLVQTPAHKSIGGNSGHISNKMLDFHQV